MTTIITTEQEKDNKEVRSVQTRRDCDKERDNKIKQGITIRHYTQPAPKDILQEEIRSVRNASPDKIQKCGRHYFDISIPKSYCRMFKIGQGDLFAWDLVKTEPLTFSLRKMNTGANA